MPLRKGTSTGTFEYNLRKELQSGRDREQALARAYAQQRQARKEQRREKKS